MRRARIEPFEIAVGAGAMLLLAWALTMAGCHMSGWDIARVGAIGLNQIVIEGEPLATKAVEDCAAEVIKRTDAKDFAGAHKRQAECEVMRTRLGLALVSGKDVAAVARPAIEAGEQAKAKNWGAVVGPVYSAVTKIVAAFKEYQLILKTKVEGVN